MTRIRAILLAILLLLTMSTFARATDLPLGQPMITGSWSNVFVTPRSSTYDTIELFITSGGPFESPGVGNFLQAESYYYGSNVAASTWSGHLVNPGYALATGSTSDLTFYPGTGSPYALIDTVYFASDIGSPLSYDLLAWSGGVFGTLISVSHVSWNGSGFSSEILEPPPGGFDPSVYNRTAVPEPASLLLLGSGLGAIGFAAWRRRK